MSVGRSAPAAWLGLAALATLSTCAPLAPAFGQAGAGSSSPSVAIGEIGSRVGGPASGRALRAALSEEITSLGGIRLSRSEGARYVLRGAITRLERRRVDRGLEVQGEVSLILADASGNVQAMLSGRAGARGGGDAEHVEQAAMHAAVRGALRPLPRTLRGRR